MRKPWHDERTTCSLAPRDERWLQRTARYAQGLKVPWPVACMIVRGSRVLAIGTVKLRNEITSCADTPWLCSEHAEMNALRMVKYPQGATAYVVRVGADKTMRHAQPCRRCREELERSGVRMVWSSE
jgi:pyrimidine deaminase RibD-like protein